MSRTCEAVSHQLRVPRAMGSRWAAELGWSPGQGNHRRDTLTVGQAVGLEVYGTLCQQHRGHRRWRPLAHTCATFTDYPTSTRWIVHLPWVGPDQWSPYDDDDLQGVARYVNWWTRHGKQVIVVDLHHLAARWADSPPCPPPRRSPSSSSPPSSPPPSSRS